MRKDLLESARRTHEAHGLDFASYFNSYFDCHYVFKGPDFFLMGREDPEDRDAWLVWWAECHPARPPADMLRLFLRLMPHYRPRIAWFRSLKGHREIKYYSTERLLRLMEGRARSK